ncbi:MAG: DUF3788 family protein [Candidatus Latescibacterota bacterium]
MVEKPVLSNKDIFPSEEVIFSHIGGAKDLWLSLFGYIHTEHPDFLEEWKFYRDGNSWLLKVTKKKKTIFWLSIIRDSFRTTFYFPAKAEELILASALSVVLKEQYRNGPKYNKIRGLTISYRNQNDIEEAKKLIELKAGMK